MLLLSIFSNVTKSNLVSPEVFENKINISIAELIEQKHQVNRLLKEKIKKHGFFDFNKLTNGEEYNSVFNNGNLVYWGSNIFLPDYQRIKGNFKEKYIELKPGKFLAVKDTLLFRNEIFEIVNLIPLYYSYNISNQYIRSGPNPAIFGSNIIDINNYGIDKDISIKNRDGNFLFSLQFSEQNFIAESKLDFVVLVSLILFISFLTAFFWQQLPIIHKYIYEIINHERFRISWKRYEADLLMLGLVLYAVLVRTIMLLCDIPHSIISLRVFNPKYYRWGSVTPSPGDLVIHMFFAVFLLLAVKKLFRKTSLYEPGIIKNNKKISNNLFIIITLIVSQLCLFLIGNGVYSIFKSLKYPIDISEIMGTDISLYFTLLYFILATGLFIGISRIAYEVISKDLRYAVFRQYIPSVLIFIALAYFSNSDLALVVIFLHFIFFLLVYFLRLPATKHSFDYSALVYYTLGALLCAITGTFSLSQLYPRRDLELKTDFITQQLAENNLLGESLLNEISRQVSSDGYVANSFTNSLFSTKDMDEKIRRFYLGNYLNRYDIQIKAFDNKGSSLNADDPRPLQQVLNRFPYKLYRTNYPEIYYYITQQNQILKNYISNINISSKGLKTGSVLIDLQTKKFIPNSILPILFRERKTEYYQNTGNYSYAVYNNGELTNTFGNFNFKKEIIREILEDSARYNTNVEIAGSYFLVSNLGKGRKIIVQSEVLPRWVQISNMSFLFIITELAIFLFFLSNLLLFDFDQFYNSLTFKIQFYTIASFFIPVSLVSIGVLTAVISSYNQELKTHFKENATNIAYALSEELESYYYKTGNLERLNEYVLRSARLYNTDVNIYRKSGALLMSSSPVLYESGLVSRIVNPYAYHAIRQEKNKLHLQEEKIGSLNYNHVYVQVRSSETGDELGIISIPFFASGQELSLRITNALKIIINIATLTFMVFIFFSYAASNFITYPLKLITHRIRKTTLEGDNRPLDWKSKDELGLLIREYNKMLQKLEQNKKTMALSQKEIAWREVAQQVAHEIKNPLTPIKLSLQHLKRVISDGGKTEPAKLEKTIENLINQVEILDGIASSFSVYAKMPSFQLHKVNLLKTVEKVIEFYTSDSNISVECLIPEKELFIKADEKMLGRILANLLLNAFQAIPSERKGKVLFVSTNTPDRILLDIRDNGSGIPKDAIEKVFEPHFSTKFSGSGIGLFVVKKGIEQMGGTIDCKSDTEGTTFILSFQKYND